MYANLTVKQFVKESCYFLTDKQIQFYLKIIIEKRKFDLNILNLKMGALSVSDIEYDQAFHLRHILIIIDDLKRDGFDLPY